MILDFLSHIQTDSIFESSMQLTVLIDHVKKSSDGEQSTMNKKCLEQYHLGLVILLADFIHLLFK